MSCVIPLKLAKYKECSIFYTLSSYNWRVRTLKTLENTDPAVIFSAFEKAFASYFVPFHFIESEHYKRWKLAGVDFSVSYGVFEDQKLCAFILHVPLGEKLFNFATGVIPEARGKRHIDLIYQEMNPQKFKTMSLEVIIENEKAIKVYTRVGFRITRRLHTLKGKLNISSVHSKHRYEILNYQFDEEMRALQKGYYSLEQAEPVLHRKAQELEVHKLYSEAELLAYVIFEPQTLSIKQIEFRNALDDVLELLDKMKLNQELITVPNIEGSRKDLLIFLKTNGLENYVSQFEMIKHIS